MKAPWAIARAYSYYTNIVFEHAQVAIARITRISLCYRFSLGCLFGCRGQRPIHPKLHPKSNELLRMLVRILVWDYLDKNPELLFVLFVRFVVEKTPQLKSQPKCARLPRFRKSF